MKKLPLIALLLLSSALSAQPLKPDPGALRAMVGRLASEQAAGRYPGTRGDSLASAIVAGQFRKIGLESFGDSYFQPFELPVSQKMEGDNSLVLGGEPLAPGRDYRPAYFSAGAGAGGEVAFVGYGLRSADSTIDWDDYRDADVKGKCVLVLRGMPDTDRLGGAMSHLRSDRSKALLAQDMGAAAVIFINPARDTADRFGAPSGREFPLGIPVVQLGRKVAERIFGGDALADRESGMGAMRGMGAMPPAMRDAMAAMKEGGEKSPAGMSRGGSGIPPKALAPNRPIARIEAKMQVGIAQVTAPTHNIVGFVRGKDKALRDQYVVVGAHYDHLGLGGPGSGSRRPDTAAIHYGADDNASGVASMLALAGHFARHRPARSLIFVAFGAEEEGVVGSKFFAGHLPVDSSAVVAMLNFDMVGHLRSSALTVGGSGTSVQSDSLIRAHGEGTGLKLTLSPEGHGPSDHAPFYAKRIPVFYFTTGGTLDYHTPADRPEKLNYPGMDTVVRYAGRLLADLAGRPERLSFREAGQAGAEPMRARFKVTLGLMPDVTGGSNDGLRADIVVKGKPADRAGIRSGDVIVSIDGLGVNNIEDYMQRLSQLTPGGKAEVKVRRGGETLVFSVDLSNDKTE